MEKRLEELLKKAIRLNASDIHISKQKNKKVRIEMRVNQDIIKIKTRENDEKLLDYLKYQSNLDVSNQLVPVTGRFDIEVSNTTLSLRFAYMQSFNIVVGVLRILNHKLKLDLSNISRISKQNEYLSSLCSLDYGLIIISGSTGSGKTSTLYTILDAARKRKIYTIEDPIEIYSENFVQLQINKAVNMDYQSCLKQLLRHDPDIIVIGEIRDKETAEVAVKAAISGHLVIATLHSSTASSAILRLQEFGISEIYLQDMLQSVINQKLCSDEKGRYAVYEIMDRKTLEYYFTHKKLPGSFHPKDYYIHKAAKTEQTKISEGE